MGRVIATFGCLFFLALPLRASCNTSIVVKEANLAKIYYHLRRSLSECSYGASIYNQFAARGILGGRMAEALWSARIAEKKARGNLSKAYARVLQSRALLGLGRHEEAIRILQPLVTGEVASSTRLRSLQERGHLAMIQAYYDRAGRSKDRNVIYLVNLFKNRYPGSKYLPLLKDWVS